MKTPKIGKFEAVVVISIICFIAIPTVPAIRTSTPAGASQGVVVDRDDNGLIIEEIRQIQTPEYQNEPPEPEYNLVLDGEPQNPIVSWQTLPEFPEIDNFGGLPYYSLIWPAGIYYLEDPNDITGPLVLYGARIWICYRYTLFSDHFSYVNGTITYNMHSGGTHVQEVYAWEWWPAWQPWWFPIRLAQLPCYDSYPNQCIESIDCDLDFYEDGRFIWHYDHTIPMYWVEP